MHWQSIVCQSIRHVLTPEVHAACCAAILLSTTATEPEKSKRAFFSDALPAAGICSRICSCIGRAVQRRTRLRIVCARFPRGECSGNKHDRETCGAARTSFWWRHCRAVFSQLQGSVWLAQLNASQSRVQSQCITAACVTARNQLIPSRVVGGGVADWIARP